MPIGIKRFNYYSKVLNTIKFKLIKMHFLSSTQVVVLSEQFQKFITTQPHVMFASLIRFIALSSSSVSSYRFYILELNMALDSLSFASLSPMSALSIMTVDDTLIPLASVRFVNMPHLSL